MWESGYYPPGAEHDPNAPWNQDFEENEAVDVKVCISTCLSKNTSISVTDYVKESWEDWDVGDEGEAIHTGGIYNNFDNTDFNKEYLYEHKSPIQLLAVLKELASEKINVLTKQLETESDKSLLTKLRKEINDLKNIQDDADNWVEDEFDVFNDDK